jgi:mannose-6-phosphate isomerase-like protein (cupin superfamily)
MLHSLPLFFALFLSPAQAQQPKDSAKDVTLWHNGVPSVGITHKDDYGSHILSISHREENGRAEVHQTKADVMVIQSGEATFVYGGDVIDPKSTAPNEIQGSGIKGGTTITVRPGDVIHIPVGVPHQFFLAPGKQITYFLVKVVNP